MKDIKQPLKYQEHYNHSCCIRGILQICQTTKSQENMEGMLSVLTKSEVSIRKTILWCLIQERNLNNWWQSVWNSSRYVIDRVVFRKGELEDHLKGQNIRNL